MTEKNEEALKVFGAKGTKKVLEFLNQHVRAQYKEMGEFKNLGTLNIRLNELLDLGLISHHLERVETRREWYELTEKGKQALKYLRALVELTVSSS